MRTFILETGTDRKVVRLEIDGPCVVITERAPDGSKKQSEKVVGSEAEARAVREKMAAALLQRGFVEKTTASAAAAPPKAAVSHAFDDLEEPAAPLLPRMAAPVAAEEAPKKKKKKKKRKKEGAEEGNDKRVVLLAAAFGFGLIGLVGWVTYDTFMKPPSIVGVWKGSRLEYEAGGPMSYSKYVLVLDPEKRAAMTLDESITSTGTYSVKGDRLILKLKGEKDEGSGAEDGEEGGKGGGEEGATDEIQYKISLGRSTLDLLDPSTGKKVVELIRFPSEVAKVGGAKSAKEKTPTGPAAGEIAAGNKADDAKLASVEYVAKDTAFKLKHPKGWSAETGGRADNSYSWIKLEKGSARVKVTADVTGSLMSGSDVNRNPEPGSTSAPVHVAHELYARIVKDEYSDYKESEPVVFNGSGLGEGRVSSFTASGGGLFGGTIQGYRVTLLTGDRRVVVMCECPKGEFEKNKKTFLAVCRSVTR